MIRQVNGDILLSKARVIAHGVAPNDDHARDSRTRCASMRPRCTRTSATTARRSTRRRARSGPGRAPTASAGGAVHATAGLHPGERPGRATLSNVHHALQALRRFIDEERPASLALSRLATGVGGLDWDEVLPEIEKHLGDAGIPIIVYSTYHAGQAAAEGL